MASSPASSDQTPQSVILNLLNRHITMNNKNERKKSKRDFILFMHLAILLLVVIVLFVFFSHCILGKMWPELM